MGIAFHEQETVIQFSRDENTATIYTSDRTVMTRLNKMPSVYTRVKEDVEKDSGDVLSVTYRVPKRLISFRSKIAASNLTEEQKQASAERLRRWREQQKGGGHDGETTVSRPRP